LSVLSAVLGAVGIVFVLFGQCSWNPFEFAQKADDFDPASVLNIVSPSNPNGKPKPNSDEELNPNSDGEPKSNFDGE
jgi:hypothetical protein